MADETEIIHGKLRDIYSLLNNRSSSIDELDLESIADHCEKITDKCRIIIKRRGG